MPPTPGNSPEPHEIAHPEPSLGPATELVSRRVPRRGSPPEAPPASRSAAARFAPGERLAHRFRIERLLGRGGMGEAYEAQDEELGIAVALKALHPEIGRDRGALRRLKREVLLARSVTHPSVSRVYDLGRHDDGAAAWAAGSSARPRRASW